MQESGTDAFEHFVADALSLTQEFLDDVDQVGKVWIYVWMREGSTGAGAYFEVEEQILDVTELAARYKGTTDAEQLDSFRLELVELADELARALHAAGESPSRIVVTLDAAAGSVDADFSYGDDLEGPDDDPGTAMADWFEEFAEPGEATAT